MKFKISVDIIILTDILYFLLVISLTPKAITFRIKKNINLHKLEVIRIKQKLNKNYTE